MEFTAQQIAELLEGTVEGDPQVKVSNLAKIEEGIPGTLTFLANPKYEEFIYSTKASLVIVNESFVAEKPINSTLVRVKDAYKSFAKLLETYNQILHNRTGIESPNFISTTATLGENIYVGAFVYIGEKAVIGNNVKLYPGVYVGDNASIGDGTILFPGVKVYADCHIGKNCRIHAGVVVGADGFGFAPQDDSNYIKVAQIGNVIIEDHVEIGSNTTLDRATLGSTIIRKGVKLDNLIQVAHNVEIGEHTVIAAQTGIAGSTKIGKFCMIGGQVGIVGHLVIADKVKIAAQSGIGTSILNEGDILQGSPAYFIGDYKKSYIGFRKLPELQNRIEELEKLVKELQPQKNG
jgi:UDP-3-O-[3-hydroxymyristoyl] glucosamine N-acyltransferase